MNDGAVSRWHPSIQRLFVTEDPAVAAPQSNAFSSHAAAILSTTATLGKRSVAFSSRRRRPANFETSLGESHSCCAAQFCLFLFQFFFLFLLCFGDQTSRSFFSSFLPAGCLTTVFLNLMPRRKNTKRKHLNEHPHT